MSVVVVALVTPLRVTVAAVPPADGLIVPEMLRLALGVDELFCGAAADKPPQPARFIRRKTRHANPRTTLGLKFFGFTETLRRGVNRLAPIH
jgi:hypothetical protein